MTDSLLPVPASINSQECDCKWARRPMGGSVIRLDIPRDTVSINCNIKSARGHTSIHLTPWESQGQYKRWNQESYPLHDRTHHLVDRFGAAERKARSILQSRCMSLQHMAHTGWMYPAQQSSPYYEHPAEYRASYSEEYALVYHDLQRPGLQEDMPEEDREGEIDMSARPPIDPPTYEEALHSLGRAPTVADLGPHSPGSCSSSLVPYEAGEDSNPKEDQDPQERAPKQMETEEPAMVDAPAKEGMGIAVGPEEYLPASPRYERDGKDDTDDQDTDGDEDVEAPFLAPKDDPTSRTPQDVQVALLSLKGNTATAKDPQVSSNDESVPELIDLGKEEDAPPPSLPPKRVKHPTTLGLDKKMATTAGRSPIPPPPSPQVKLEEEPL